MHSDEKIDLEVNQDGYLFLASKKSSGKLYENHKIQLNNDAKVRLYDKDQLKSTFKWINSDDIELGSFGK
jgi:FAD-dependent oxidoreductase domain-containing protein 1